MISRRHFLAAGAAAALIRPKPALSQTTGVTPVFIKWDAWYDNTSDTSAQINHQQLSPNRWQFRAPWFCDVLGTERITCAGTQAHVDIELQAAAAAGIKAFCYVWYGGDATGAGLSIAYHKGWQLHQSSLYKDLTKWCGYIGLNKFGFNPWSNTAGWHANCDIWANDYFKRSNYLKVGGRPVVFIPWQPTVLTSHFANSTADTITAFNYLRSQSIASGAGDPYIISTGDLSGATNSVTAKPWITGDAVSSYIANSAISYPALPQPAADLYTRTAGFWAGGTMVGSGSKTVPIAMMAWDKRPRIELPEFGSISTPWVGHQQYYTRGTPAQMAGHLQDCVNFIGANQPACDSKIMWVYAWNECSEGGPGGVPTIGDPPTGSPPTTALLTAIKPVLTAAA